MSYKKRVFQKFQKSASRPGSAHRDLGTRGRVALRRAGAPAVLALLAAGSAAFAGPSHAVTEPVRRPVLIVGGGMAWQIFMTGQRDYLRSHGWTSVTTTQLASADRLGALPGSASLRDSALRIKGKVDEIRRTHPGVKVDITAHSAGAPAARWYIKYLGGDRTVENLVSIGGVNYGDASVRSCAALSFPGCVDLMPGSPALTELNAGDQTFGPTRYFHFYSDNGFIWEAIELDPANEASGAVVNRRIRHCDGTNPGHAAESSDPAFLAHISLALTGQAIPTNGVCPG